MLAIGAWWWFGWRWRCGVGSGAGEECLIGLKDGRLADDGGKEE